MAKKKKRAINTTYAGMNAAFSKIKLISEAHQDLLCEAFEIFSPNGSIDASKIRQWSYYNLNYLLFSYAIRLNGEMPNSQMICHRNLGIILNQLAINIEKFDDHSSSGYHERQPKALRNPRRQNI